MALGSEDEGGLSPSLVKPSTPLVKEIDCIDLDSDWLPTILRQLTFSISIFRVMIWRLSHLYQHRIFLVIWHAISYIKHISQTRICKMSKVYILLPQSVEWHCNMMAAHIKPRKAAVTCFAIPTFRTSAKQQSWHHFVSSLEICKY